MRKRTNWGPALLVLTLLPVLACETSPNADAADLVLTNGKVVTMDPNLPQAEAIAVKGQGTMDLLHTPRART